jgi:hypothetical protein
VGRASVEKVSGQMVNEVADRSDVYGGMKTWYGGAPGEVANDAETFVL